jgi:hypothetical protein
MNKLNSKFQISSKEEEEMKKLDEELQREEELTEFKKKHCCYCFKGFIKHKCLLHMYNNDYYIISSSNYYFYGYNGINFNGLWK